MYKTGKTVGHAEYATPVKENEDIYTGDQTGPERAHVYQCKNDNLQSQAQDPQADMGDQEMPSHLQKMYLENISELSHDQKSKSKKLITEFSDVFSKDDFDLGCLNNGVEHKIQTYDEIPTNEKFRQTPFQFQKQEQEYLEKLLKQGVIEPSMSEWSAAPVLVRKKTGELRYCIDYQALNNKIYKDNYSLPLIEDCLDSLYGKSMFRILDVCSGYYQIPLQESCRHKTSFNTRFGSYQWTRLPMGLCTAPATFSRAIQLVMCGLTWEEVLVYLDDIIVLGTDFDDILSALRKVFLRFHEYHLKLKPRKCHYFREKVEFLGKMVSGNGVSILPDKLEAVKGWPVPTNVKELQSFLGFMSYHRNHIQNFAQVSADLYALIHAESFYWKVGIRLVLKS